MQPCSFPLCRRYGNPYCLFHAKIYGSPATKTKDQAIVPIPKITEKAQTVFNSFIRDRDKNKGCITCGSQITDAGHFIPVGENAALRFDPDNVHGQCAECNRYEFGKRKQYREALIQLLGIERVKELETAPKFHKWSREQLNNIIETYSLNAIEA